MKKPIQIILIAALLAALPLAVTASFAARIPAIEENDRVVLQGNVHPKANPQFEVGPTNPSLPVKRMILLLKMSPDKQAAADRLLAEQQDPTSPNYHKWLTPEQFGERFGRSPDEIATVKGWLISNGFTVEETAKGANWINFSGTVAQLESAFHAKMHDYNVNGRLHHANSTDPSIPRALSDIVAGPATLHTFGPKPALSRARPMASKARQPGYTYTDQNGDVVQALAPGDMAVIYNINGVYNQGFDGTGVTIALVEETHPKASPGSWNTFRSTFGLPFNQPKIIPNVDPGDQGIGDDQEADLDTELAGAAAPGATIDFVVSGPGGINFNNTVLQGFGVDLSAQYIVDNNLAPIVSYSYGTCEQDMGRTWLAFYSNLWMQGSLQGMTIFVVTGDTGAYDCTNNNTGYPVAPKAVNGIASTPYNIAVGGTRFNLNTTSEINTFWSPNNSANYVSALNYPTGYEVAWNDLYAYSPSPGTTVQYYEAAAGGGASTYSKKPSWQVSPGVPNDGHRDLPDISLNADDINFPYLVYTCTNSTGACTMPAPTPVSQWPQFGGTSAAAPSLAGIMALLVQSAGGERQGNFNTSLYKFAQAQYGKKSGAIAVFHDITSGTNGFVGSGANLPGYSCTVGYDLVTGLGSVDALNLLQAFQEDLTINKFAVTAPPAATIGVAFNFTVTPLDASNNVLADYTGTVHFSSTDLAAKLPADTTLLGPGSFSAVLNTAGNQTITATSTRNAATTGTSNVIVVNPVTGSLKVTISPAGAVSAGAKWSIDGGNTWNSTGQTLSNVPIGPHTVTFEPITGWTSPAPKKVTILKNRTTSVTGAYVEQMGTLEGIITPSGAITAGARWSYDGGKTWHANKASVKLQVGNYTVSYKGVSGWNPPSPLPVTVTQNHVTQATGGYTQLTGSLK